LKVPEGCAICESTWGNYYEEVEGQRMFFCCDICAAQFRNMIAEVKKRTGWQAIGEIKIRGDYRGREITAISDDNNSVYKFLIRFDSRGAIQNFSPV
jgi:Ta0938